MQVETPYLEWLSYLIGIPDECGRSYKPAPFCRKKLNLIARFAAVPIVGILFE